MKLRVVYRDDVKPTEYANVSKVQVVPIGVGTYNILNDNNQMIAHVPCDVVRRLECPEHDSPIVTV